MFSHTSFLQLITMYYNMLPESTTTPTLPNERSHDQSRDQTTEPTNEGPTFQQMFSAIRMSLSGEAEGIAGEGDGEGGREEEVGENSSPPTVELVVPDDLPVDMRVKLAVCLIHRSLPLPPSLLPPVTAHPEEYGDLFIDLAEAYTEMGEWSRVQSFIGL